MMYGSLWSGVRAGVIAAAVLGIAWSGPASAQGFSITISVDENGNGLLANTDGVHDPLAAGFENDPGPGGLNNVLTYGLFNPPGLTSGDLLLTEPSSNRLLSDVVRFNANEVCPDGSVGCLVFYSDNTDGFDSRADTPSPPLDFYANTLTLAEAGPEGDNGVVYTPIAGQPGFVAGAAGPVTYVIHSDTPVPEPAPVLLLGVGLIGLGVARRRR